MKINTIGIMSPGSMGQAFARQLRRGGFHVVTALERRSARTRGLAAAAGIADVGSVVRLAECCDVILSIMNPGNAREPHLTNPAH